MNKNKGIYKDENTGLQLISFKVKTLNNKSFNALGIIL